MYYSLFLTITASYLKIWGHFFVHTVHTYLQPFIKKSSSLPASTTHNSECRPYLDDITEESVSKISLLNNANGDNNTTDAN